ncbi:MAG: branched-chain amino acid ABC transporter permease [Candidatus Dormibacteria bacterium]
MSERARLVRRGLLALGGLMMLVALLMPLTSTDTVQAMGLPNFTDKLWFRVATTVAMFVVLSSAWNIIGGMAGYAAFGNVAFFGVGAYATGFLVSHRQVPFAIALVAAPALAAVFAVLIGLPLLRLRGHYFAIATLGVSVAIGEVVNNIEPLGGATGIFLPIVRSDILFFYLMAGAAVLAVGVSWTVLRTRFGYGLLAIRENEEAAAVIGINTTLYKVAAFALAAGLTGLAGGIFAQWNVFINAENVFPVDYNVQMILMAVIGGSGTVLGPVVGAVALEALIQAFASGGAFAAWSQVGLGVLLAVTVMFVPRGILDFLGGQSRLSLQYLRASLRRTSV